MNCRWNIILISYICRCTQSIVIRCINKGWTNQRRRKCDERNIFRRSFWKCMLTYNNFLRVISPILQLTCEYARLAKVWSSIASFSQEECNDVLGWVLGSIAWLEENETLIAEGEGETDCRPSEMRATRSNNSSRQKASSIDCPTTNAPWLLRMKQLDAGFSCTTLLHA